jgi:hypothetical protein
LDPRPRSRGIPDRTLAKLNESCRSLLAICCRHCRGIAATIEDFTVGVFAYSPFALGAAVAACELLHLHTAAGLPIAEFRHSLLALHRIGSAASVPSNHATQGEICHQDGAIVAMTRRDDIHTQDIGAGRSSDLANGARVSVNNKLKADFTLQRSARGVQRDRPGLVTDDSVLRYATKSLE